MRARAIRWSAFMLAAAAPLALAAAPAVAHIQVRPAQAAPGDPVLWTVLVPSEQESGTRQVELAVPKDVLPFSFEDSPGWTRRTRPNPDGSLRSIVWRGRTPADGLATFRFLASAPEREGAIAWKAIQTYRDGGLVRWIGGAGSEHPASITRIAASVPRENAGGEGAATSSAPAAQTTPAVADRTEDDPDWIARGLGIAALLVAAAAALAAVRRRATPPS